MSNIKIKQYFSQRLGSADEIKDLQSIVKFTVNVVNEKGSFSKHQMYSWHAYLFFALVQAIEAAAATTVTVKAERWKIVEWIWWQFVNR